MSGYGTMSEEDLLRLQMIAEDLVHAPEGSEFDSLVYRVTEAVNAYHEQYGKRAFQHVMDVITEAVTALSPDGKHRTEAMLTLAINYGIIMGYTHAHGDGKLS